MRAFDRHCVACLLPRKLGRVGGGGNYTTPANGKWLEIPAPRKLNRCYTGYIDTDTETMMQNEFSKLSVSVTQMSLNDFGNEVKVHSLSIATMWIGDCLQRALFIEYL